MFMCALLIGKEKWRCLGIAGGIQNFEITLGLVVSISSTYTYIFIMHTIIFLVLMQKTLSGIFRQNIIS